MDIAALCRKLSDFHGMMDLPERVRETVDLQRQQRVALAQAAEVIERQAKRIAELEAVCKESPPSPSLEASGHESGLDPRHRRKP